MQYLPSDTVMTVPQLGLQEWEKREEKLPILLGSTIKISYPRGSSWCFSRQILQNQGMQFLRFFFFSTYLMKSYRSYHRHGQQISPKYSTIKLPYSIPLESMQIAPFPLVWILNPLLSYANSQFLTSRSAYKQSLEENSFYYVLYLLASECFLMKLQV